MRIDTLNHMKIALNRSDSAANEHIKKLKA